MKSYSRDQTEEQFKKQNFKKKQGKIYMKSGSFLKDTPCYSYKCEVKAQWQIYDNSHAPREEHLITDIIHIFYY